MTEQGRHDEADWLREERLQREERRMREAAVTAATRRPPEPRTDPADPEDEDDSASAQRFEQREMWIDAQIRDAMARGEFDDLPGAGKPIPGLDRVHDPDWWVKRLVEREDLTPVLPPALALRKEDAELDERIDREPTEQDVRRLLEDFNQRVVEARRQLLGGPPVITPTRDVEQELAAWRSRREERRARPREQARSAAARTRRARPARSRRAGWWPRRRRNP